MGHARLGVVAHRAAQVLELHLLARDRLDHVGARDEHVGGLLDHEDEVRDGRGVDGAARARAHDQADLRDDARALDVAHEDVAVGAQRDDALLDARAARVVDPDDGAADLGRQVHHLAHLLAHDLAQGPAEHREVLGEDAHAAALDRPVPGDHGVAPRPVAVHVELGGAVAHEGVELLEGARVQQLLDPLARRVLAAVVLLGDGVVGALASGLAQLAELRELLLVGLRRALARHRARTVTRPRVGAVVRRAQAVQDAGQDPEELGVLGLGRRRRDGLGLGLGWQLGLVRDRRDSDREPVPPRPATPPPSRGPGAAGASAPTTAPGRPARASIAGVTTGVSSVIESSSGGASGPGAVAINAATASASVGGGAGRARAPRRAPRRVRRRPAGPR